MQGPRHLLLEQMQSIQDLIMSFVSLARIKPHRQQSKGSPGGGIVLGTSSEHGCTTVIGGQRKPIPTCWAVNVLLAAKAAGG